MAQPINCNFARGAIYHHTKAKFSKNHRLPKGLMASIIHTYNQQFSEYESLKTSYKVAAKKFLAITRIISKSNWPTGKKEAFLKTFSPQAWSSLDEEKKQQHTLKGCEACKNSYSEVHFPSDKSQKSAGCSTSPTLTFSPEDTSSPETFGAKLIAETNQITKQLYNKSIQDVLQETPKSRLVREPSKKQETAQRHKVFREAKRCIENELKKEGDSIVLGNRISWDTYNNIRKAQGLKRRTESTDTPSAKRRKHGCNGNSLQIDKESLLEEAKTWQEGQKINWSTLATKYGLVEANRGQIIKEFLNENNIAQAKIEERPARVPRRSKKRVSGGRISMPMLPTVKKVKKDVKDKIESGEIYIGEEVLRTTYTSYKENEVTTQEKDVFARKIPLLHIRTKLLQKHEQMGLIRDNPDSYYSQLSEEEVKVMLKSFNEQFEDTDSCTVLRQKLIRVSRQRHFKIWHDHSDISGHSHLLVVVSAVYDPAFYMTESELNFPCDVQATVEVPEIHILARSTSSLSDQQTFSMCRRDCLNQLNEPVYTLNGTCITDIIRFFHGDGPAQQFEAGNKIGGHYPCTGCDAKSSLFDDIAHSFRADQLTLTDRQTFILKGVCWKESSINPFRDLKVAELRAELQSRGISTFRKKRQELDQIMMETQKGIANLPALLQPTPEMSLESANLQKYEVFPTEPLHDLKGHLSSIIGAAS